MCGILWGWVKSLRSRKNAGMNIRNYHLFWWLMSRKIWALHPGHQKSDRIPPIFSWPWSYPYTPTFIGWNSHHISAKSQKSMVSKLFFLFFPRRKRGKTLTKSCRKSPKIPMFFWSKAWENSLYRGETHPCAPCNERNSTSWSEAWPGRCPKICGDIDRKYHIYNII